MKTITDQKSIFRFTTFFIMLLCIPFLIACKEQEKTIASQKNTIEPIKENKTYTPPLLSLNAQTVPNNTFVDLFYEGQLCHWVRGILQDKRGHLWMGTNHYGVIRQDGTSLKYFTDEEEFMGSRINGIAEDNKGNLWIGSSKGITKYDGNSFTLFTEKDGLVNNDVWSVTIDSKNNVWIGTIDGVSRFDGTSFATFNVSKAALQDAVPMLSKNRIPNIIEDRNGHIWFATDGYGISKYDGKDFTFFTTKNGLPGNNVSRLMKDSKGNIWIGSMYGGLSRFDGNSFTNFTKDGVIKGIEIGGLFEDSKGNIWLSAEHEGVYRYDGKDFINFSEKDGLVSNGIISIYEDKDGTIWLGGWKGLSRYDGTSFTTVTQNGPWIK